MNRINVLLKQDQRLFHTQDLALLWGITNRNTLYTTIRRYSDKGILIPIHKGFYSTVPMQKIDERRLGLSYLHTYGYISTETVLIQNGIIFQQSNTITIVSSISKKFSLGGKNYLSRSVSDRFLYNSFGISKIDGIYVASIERAVADILYFQPKYYFDNHKGINWQKARELQKFIGYI